MLASTHIPSLCIRYVEKEDTDWLRDDSQEESSLGILAITIAMSGSAWDGSMDRELSCCLLFYL